MNDLLRVVLVANQVGPVPGWVLEQLAANRVAFNEHRCNTPHDVVAACQDADVIWVMAGSEIVDAGVLSKMPRCRAVLRTGSGTDNVPVEAATRLGIYVANTPNAVANVVAEHTIGLLFSVIRQITAQDRLVRQGIWDAHRAWPAWSLSGRTLGLVGFGRIAQLVAEKTRGFEMRLLMFDPAVTQETAQKFRVHKVSLEELLSTSDFVSIHVPLLDRTRHLIGENELRQMKKLAVLINTARGAVIDEAALIKSLRLGWIAGAGLDVLEMEPPSPDNPLLKLNNVVITPHIAGYCAETADSFWRHSVETLVAMAGGGPPLWVVNPEVVPRRSPPEPHIGRAKPIVDADLIHPVSDRVG